MFSIKSSIHQISINILQRMLKLMAGHGELCFCLIYLALVWSPWCWCLTLRGAGRSEACSMGGKVQLLLTEFFLLKVLPLFSVRHLKGVAALFYSSCLITYLWPFLNDVIVNITAPIGKTLPLFLVNTWIVGHLYFMIFFFSMMTNFQPPLYFMSLKKKKNWKCQTYLSDIKGNKGHNLSM